MKDFQKTLKELRELSTINEETKALLEKMTGKELVDYESIDALVGALMRHYNGELKKKAQTSHNHDERYYTEGEIDTKFKNYCPISVGSIDVRYDNKNPAELYPNTTWELLSSDKYIRTGTTPLNTGGSNSVSIQKANLPNVTLRVNSFTLTTQSHKHGIKGLYSAHDATYHTIKGCFAFGLDHYNYNEEDKNACYNGGGQNTGTASPTTEILGNNTALSIQPAYITLKFWKRLT